MTGLTRAIARIGARGLLTLLGGMATLAATTCGAYGSPSCHDDRDCARSMWTRCNLELHSCVTECTTDEDCGAGNWVPVCNTERGYCTRPAASGPDAGNP